MSSTNEYYKLVEDADLNSNEGYHGMILACNECGAMFGMKACGNRTLFEWFGYHPTDGNCKVVTNDFLHKNSQLVRQCDCEEFPKRLTSKSELDKAINRAAK